MQCSVCHNEVEPASTFCNHCGAPMAAATGAPSAATPGSASWTSVGPTPGNSVPPPPAYAVPPLPAGPGLSDNAASAIAYITFIPAIIFLVLEPYNRVALVRFHAWQSIGLTLAAVLLQFVLAISGMMLHFIPGIFLLLSLVHLILGLAIFLAWLIAILKASKGQWFKLPIIGDFAQKQARGPIVL